MSQGADVSSTWTAQFDRLVDENRRWLAERGELVVGSGCFRSGPLSGSVHCDFGPPGQDKRVNQDYALVWRAPAEDHDSPRLVVAISDGLTNSFRAEDAAALACWVSARSLIEAFSAASPKDLATIAFNAAGHALGQLADTLTGDPEASCPDGQFLSTWKYILKKGSIFQTTLTLTWIDAHCFNLAIVGDGGALWRSYDSHDAGRPNDRILAACDLETQQVHALGPNDRSVLEFDCWQEEPLAGPFLCALMTDGVGRGIGKSPLSLLDEIDRLHLAGEEYGKKNDAARFIERATRERPKDFDDNVTLAVIRSE